MTPRGMGTAADRLAEIRQNTSDAVLRLAYHAALPVVIDAGLLNLLRVNFFLDRPPDVLPFEAEADLLLSPLFREIGNDLYEIDPEIRNILLIGLQTAYDSERVRQVAQLLAAYTNGTPAWTAQPELEQAQQFTALSFVEPARARAWLDDALPTTGDEALGQQWFVAMRRRLDAQPRAASASDEITRAAEQLKSRRQEDRLSAVRTLAALAQLPDFDNVPIINALKDFVRRPHEVEPGEGPPEDARLALSVLVAHRVDYVAGWLQEQPAERAATAAITQERDRAFARAGREKFRAELAPLFFLSQAPQSPTGRESRSGRDRDRLAEQFFNDLSDNVATLVSGPLGWEPGYLDRAVAAGQDWTDELLRALGTCQVFVALLSPRYFVSSWCAMEWYAFARRRVTAVGNQRPGQSCIVPVIWTPVQESRVPPVVASIQRFQPEGLPGNDIAGQYQAEGVFGLLRLGMDTAYEAVVWRLARHIAEIQYNYHVEPLVPHPSELRDVFASSG